MLQLGGRREKFAGRGGGARAPAPPPPALAPQDAHANCELPGFSWQTLAQFLYPTLTIIIHVLNFYRVSL